MAMHGTDREQLVADLRGQVGLLEADLRARAEEVAEFREPLRAEYVEAFEKGRTAAPWESWLDARVTQVAAAWVLGTVFVRFCEDNGLVAAPFLSGPGERLAEAEERHEDFFRRYPERNDRDWLVAGFEELAEAHPTAAGLFDRRHNPLWEISPSFEAASGLVRFWRRRGGDGEVRYDFTDPEWDTRFLGDLYQDLSEHARKTYALLQTPEFVEEFILDLTLEPAVEQFGLAGLRTIDPACGSGHFVLGLFHRILDKWREAEPGTDQWTLVERSLSSVHGCDKNPFAVSIARFRLLVAALRAAKATRLDQAPEFPLNLAVGDSLLHGRNAPGTQIDLLADAEPHVYATEDVHAYRDSCDLLGFASYHVVVGNPPYITVKDKCENEFYRAGYSACSGTYALSVPFAQRMFHLAIRQDGSDQDAGYVGQITANSFMKREFGKKLIEKFFQTVHLTHVIDTSGAYIPGHGTPTVILVGRNHQYRHSIPIRAVLGVRGEPAQPDDPAKGLVWSAIVDQISQPGSESEWVSVEGAERSRFAVHPWSLSGGGAGSVVESLTSASSGTLQSRIHETGFGAVTREDNAYMVGGRALRRSGIGEEWQKPLVEGDVTRDYAISNPVSSLWPYSSTTLKAFSSPEVDRFLWPHRSILRERVAYGKTQTQRNLKWFEYSMFFENRYRIALSIAFAFVATHNQFVLDRGGKVFNRSAPVIKLPEGAGEDEHVELLGVLNSSVACFWLKQVSHDKGSQGVSEGFKSQEWERFYEFTGTKLQDFPLPVVLPLELGRALDGLAGELASWEPSAVAERGVPSRERLAVARAEWSRIRGRMVAVQEELDWWVYGAYGLLDEGERARLTAADWQAVPEVELGQRPFEIVLARRVAAGEVDTAWFDRHGSTPTTEIPADWPEWYRQLVRARIEAIESRRDLNLLERPEHKRRWAAEPWEKREAEALRTWLLDQCERRELWFGLRDGFEQPRTRTVHQLADAFRDDADMHAVASLYAADHLGKPDLSLAQVLERVVADQHVPFLAALRFKEPGLRKRAQWERVWQLQREEDATGQRLDIPVPPKYTSGDFRKASYWSQRGKLDVPKERFVSYPEAGPEGDPSLLLGWAGWDHKDQAQALVNLINDRSEDAGWGVERLTPLVAGLAEVMPWVHQWHGEYDDEWGGIPAEEYQAFLDEQRHRHHLTEDDLTTWRPTPTRKGRPTTKDETQ
ncbi:BREX-2 system adenine-specific DNA-methyltransferase PglX [Saccharomonospora iraqiensis]|uniref:BREX-2 system adenine-specific DNA-methyltransferase PglX n=1 Tax=Saccharomonospora iraqiensis TaxID=52698 RepID=UPI000414A37B|nr:BREX-2 system adenine-specific DNA-methyltransferase PglX [Saccharomonospora iraqiensis]